MSADIVLGWETVLKISHLPSKLRFSANYQIFGQSFSSGHYQPTYGFLEKNWIKDHQITGSRIKDQGSVQNESNKLNKLIGVIDCSSTWLSQDLPYAKAKIRENTKYWKSHNTLWKCQFSPTDYKLILNPWSLIWWSLIRFFQENADILVFWRGLFTNHLSPGKGGLEREWGEGFWPCHDEIFLIPL